MTGTTARGRLWIDLTTVASLAPPAVGVPRVELNVAAALLATGDDVEPCLYDARLGRYVALTREGFARLLALHRSTTPGPGFVELDVRLDIDGTRGIFSRGDVFVTTGFHWRPGLANLPHLFALRDAVGLKVVATCHDLIPILFPELVPNLVDVVAPALTEVVRHADHVLCISRSAANDLATWSRTLGLSPPATSVLPIGGALPAPDAEPSARVARAADRPFVLVVGTVESRKNQDVLRRAYATLVERGVVDLPTLVVVGQIGHGGAAFVDAVAADSRVRDRIVVLSGVADHELAWLYRRCRFTLYPSIYEGWGLPVSESLAFGRPCIASDRGALTEAGGDFCVYVDPFDAAAWAVAIERWVAQPDALAACAADIARRYRAPRWEDSAQHVRRVVATLQASR